MTTTITPMLPAFDSAEWMVKSASFESDLLGDTDPTDEHYALLLATAIAYVSFAITMHWLRQGREVVLVTGRDYGRGTCSDEAVNITASSHYLPSEEEALAVWQSVADSVTPDEIRQFAGLA